MFTNDVERLNLSWTQGHCSASLFKEGSFIELRTQLTYEGYMGSFDHGRCDIGSSPVKFSHI